MGSLHLVAQTAFDELLSSWRAHAAMRERPDATIPQLSSARKRLDDARTHMHMLRVAMYPRDDEKEEALVTTLCTSLDEIVYLSWTRRVLGEPDLLRCVCGETFSTRRATEDEIAAD